MCGNKIKMFLIEVKPNLSDMYYLMVFSFLFTVKLKVIIAY